MAERLYNLVFSGNLVDGRKPLDVLREICSLLELEEPQVREMFKVGFGAVIQKEIDANNAYEMRERFREAGAICMVREIEPPPPVEAPSGSMLTFDASQTVRQPDLGAGIKSRMQPPPIAAKRNASMISLVIWFLVLATLAGGGWWCYKTWFAPAPVSKTDEP